MTWSAVESKIDFYSASSTWATNPNAPLVVLSSSDQAAIKAELSALYAGSALARDLMDRATAGTFTLKIGGANSSVGFASAAGPGDGYIGINIAKAADVYFINESGNLVNSRLGLTLIHELSHAIDVTSDPTGYGSGAGFDHRGGAVDFQNQVAAQMSWSNDQQAAYYGQVQQGEARYTLLSSGGNLTEGRSIELALLGDKSFVGSNDVIDLSARTQMSSNYIHGFGGNDTITGGRGADFLLGGDGDDRIVGGAGDLIDGGSGSDVVQIDAVAPVEISVDGAGGSLPGGVRLVSVESVIGSDVDDTFYLSHNSAIEIDGGAQVGIFEPAPLSGDTVSFAFSQSSVSVTVDQDGFAYFNGKELTSIENIVGSNYGDTFNINGWGYRDIDANDLVTPTGTLSIRPGPGSDYIDARGSYATIVYGENDGFDTFASEIVDDVETTGVSAIMFEGMYKSDLKLTFQMLSSSENYNSERDIYDSMSYTGRFYMEAKGGSTKVLLGPGGWTDYYDDEAVDDWWVNTGWTNAIDGSGDIISWDQGDFIAT